MSPKSAQSMGLVQFQVPSPQRVKHTDIFQLPVNKSQEKAHRYKYTAPSPRY